MAVILPLVVAPERDGRHYPAGAVVLWCCGAVVLWCWLVMLRALVQCDGASWRQTSPMWWLRLSRNGHWRCSYSPAGGCAVCCCPGWLSAWWRMLRRL
ncbi:TPA: hypothetical protein KC797_000785 [Escherichia coli O146]|nr:hypothetical protein [Escherichia coli O146]